MVHLRKVSGKCKSIIFNCKTFSDIIIILLFLAVSYLLRLENLADIIEAINPTSRYLDDWHINTDKYVHFE